MRSRLIGTHASRDGAGFFFRLRGADGPSPPITFGLLPFRLAAYNTRSYPAARSCFQVAFRRILVFIVLFGLVCQSIGSTKGHKPFQKVKHHESV